MHYNNWAMYLTQFMACEGYFKGTYLTLMHGTPPRMTEQWDAQFMALFLNDRRADWIARYRLLDTYPYRVGTRTGIATDPKWGITGSDIYYTDFDRPEDQMRINLTLGDLLDSNTAWLSAGQPKPTWFAITKSNYGPAATAHDGSYVLMVGKLGLVTEVSEGDELLRMIRPPVTGEFPAAEDILPFTVPIGG